MSHEIQKAVFSAREGAGWTGLGQVIPADIANDPAKIAELLGATYKVVAGSVYVQDAKGTFVKVPGFAAQYRDDSGDVMSITSDNRYFTENRQPADILEAFRDEFRKNSMEMSHAAILKGGSLVVACALMSPDFDIVVGKGDRIRRYTTLSSGYNGRNGTICTEAKERVVCANTWMYNLGQADKAARINASQRVAAGDLVKLIGAMVSTDGKGISADDSDMTSVEKVIARVAARAKLEQRVYNDMANASMAASEVLRYFADVLEVNVEHLDQVHKDGRPMVSVKMKNLITTLTEAYNTSPGAAIAQGTMWGAFNAVTHYTTHTKPVRDTKEDGENNARMAANLFGDGKRLAQRAMTLALARMKVAA